MIAVAKDCRCVTHEGPCRFAEYKRDERHILDTLRGGAKSGDSNLAALKHWAGGAGLQNLSRYIEWWASLGIDAFCSTCCGAHRIGDPPEVCPCGTEFPASTKSVDELRAWARSMQSPGAAP